MFNGWGFGFTLFLLVMNQGAKIISESIIGSDFRTVFVNGKAYTVYPPTVNNLSGAISYLSGVQEADNLKEVLFSLGEIKPIVRHYRG